MNARIILPTVVIVGRKWLHSIVIAVLDAAAIVFAVAVVVVVNAVVNAVAGNSSKHGITYRAI